MIPPRLAIVGDIHGDSQRLRWVIKRTLKQGMHLICLGDYVNRGPNSAEVLQLLLEAREAAGEQLTLLRGNHDQVLLDFLKNGNPAQFVAHGGIFTARSYLTSGQGDLETFRLKFPQDHLDLLRSTINYYETDELFISHAGFDPSNISSRAPNDIRDQGHSSIFTHSGPWPRPLTVCGHFIQREGRPYISTSLICLDTGCGTITDAPLTVLFLPDRRIEQF